MIAKIVRFIIVKGIGVDSPSHTTQNNVKTISIWKAISPVHVPMMTRMP